MTTLPAWTLLNPEPNQLGESPFWHAREQTLYWVDIDGRKVCRANAYTGEIEHWPLPETPGCIAPAAQGGWVIALRNALYHATQWRADLQLLHRFEHDPATTRFNDGKCDPQGRFWAGTMYEPRDQALAQLFACEVRTDGSLAVMTQAGGGTVANGLAFSPDAKTVYWSDTPSHRIRAWNWDATANTLSAERTFHAFAPKPPGWTYGVSTQAYGGRPDGAAVDAEGNYWVAMFEGGRIVKLSPQGQLLAELPTPALCPTMPCFGGDDLRTLYITTASHKRSAAELQQYPHSGCVFFTRVEVPGLPVNFFRN
ncbi:MAG: hypothetical protein RLZZ401_679 [Pseudomonadota bacterium]